MTTLNNYFNKDRELENEIFKYKTPTLIAVLTECNGGSYLMDLIVVRIEKEYSKKINIVRIDFETHKELLNRWGITGAPAFLIVDQGEVIEIIKDALSRKNLDKIIRKLYQRQT